MKILRLDAKVFPVSDYERESWKNLGFTRIDEINGDTPEDIIAHGGDADVVVVISNYLPAHVIDGLKKCRLIMRRGTGCDKIDIGRATEKGIMVANLPAFAAGDVADNAIMLMLAVARNLKCLMSAVDDRDWLKRKQDAVRTSTRIEGKTMGVIGFGNIGKEVAKRGKGFGMRVIDYHRNVRPEEEIALGVEPVALEYLIRESDFIILTCPKTEETHHLFGEEQFRMMKPSAYLINVSRGDVTNEADFAQALRTNQIAGGATDVFEHLNMFSPADGQPDSLYTGLDNFISTPHCAADTLEAQYESIDKAAEQIRLVVNGYYPSSWKNPEVAEKLGNRYKAWEGHPFPKK